MRKLNKQNKSHIAKKEDVLEDFIMKGVLNKDKFNDLADLTFAYVKALSLMQEHTLPSENFWKGIEILKNRNGKIVVTGIGKSAFVAGKLAATLTSFGEEAFFVHPSDAMHGDSGRVSTGDVIIAISFSGESEEVVRFVRHEKKNKDVKVLSITKSPRSTLGLVSDGVFLVEIESEGSPFNMAPMASIFASLFMADSIAVSVINKDFKEENFARLHPGGLIGLKYVKVGDKLKSIIQEDEILPVIGLEEDLKFAIQVISDKRKGVVGIVDKSFRLVGAITDGDVRRFLLKNDSIEDVLVKDMMNKSPKTVFEHASLYDTLKKMEDHKITNVFVVDMQEKVCGIIHMHDILGGELLR